jgi:uncharacterized ferredoxin-like protein
MQEKQAVREAAKIIGISIRTAPKSAGIDDITYRVLSDTQKLKVYLETKKIASILQKDKPKKVQKAIELDWHSDATAIEASDCLILVAVKGRKAMGLNCAGCGFKDCQGFLKAKSPKTIFMAGPFCIFQLLNLGIAISSAAKTASNLNIDNRIMFRAGLAGYRLGFLEGYSPVLGLPLSAAGKNIYFDRIEKLEARKLWKEITAVGRRSPRRFGRGRQVVGSK